MKNNNKAEEISTANSSIEEIKENMFAERERVENEQEKIKIRIAELKNKRRSTLKPNYNGGLSIDDIEKAAIGESYEVINKKIALLENVLSKGYMADAQYRTMAMVYLEEVEPVIQKLSEKRQSIIDESIRALREAEENREKAIIMAHDIDDEICDLLDPIGATIYTVSSELTGTYVVKCMKAEIDRWNSKKQEEV